MNELEKITVFGDGSTSPKVESGIEIILIQGSEVQVGKLNLGAQYDFNMEIEHPKNQQELAIVATEIIKEKKPEYLEAENHLILVCPKGVFDKMIW